MPGYIFKKFDINGKLWKLKEHIKAIWIYLKKICSSNKEKSKKSRFSNLSHSSSLDNSNKFQQLEF